MSTRSIFTGAIKTIETRTEKFTVTSLSDGPFAVRIPEGGLLLGGGQRFTILTPNLDWRGYLEVVGQLSADGLGWEVAPPRGLQISDTGPWKGELTITVSYAVPA
ncbi:hypothetical protein ACGFLS_09595 [Streptomyces abikoensis]|uniref:hypothetical protein n=1 Tax=Streptomyces abikoensis TaxID=97398 RepID=UPI003717E526